MRVCLHSLTAVQADNIHTRRTKVILIIEKSKDNQILVPSGDKNVKGSEISGVYPLQEWMWHSCAFYAT